MKHIFGLHKKPDLVKLFKVVFTYCPASTQDLILVVVSGARVVREPGKKWYLSHAQYGANMLPSYLNGPAYVFTGSLIPSLISCAMRCNL